MYRQSNRRRFQTLRYPVNRDKHRIEFPIRPPDPSAKSRWLDPPQSQFEGRQVAQSETGPRIAHCQLKKSPQRLTGSLSVLTHCHLQTTRREQYRKHGWWYWALLMKEVE